MLRMPRTVFTVLLGALLAACSSGGSQPAADPGQPETPAGSVVQILNNAPGASTVTVYLVPEAGVERALGTVDNGQTREFPIGSLTGRYRLRTVGAGGESVSDVFTLSSNTLVRWDMSLGRQVRVSTRR